MTSDKPDVFLKFAIRFLKRKASIILVAFMLGISNVILEENRMIHDTQVQIEQQEIQPENDLLPSKSP